MRGIPLTIAQHRAGKVLMLREPTGRSPAVPHVAVDLIRAVLDLGDLFQEDRPAVEHADDQIAQLPSIAERLAGLDANQPIHVPQIAGRPAHVGGLDGTLQSQRRHVVGRHPVGIHQHANHSRPPAHNIGP
jgi:hypothetical protein